MKSPKLNKKFEEIARVLSVAEGLGQEQYDIYCEELRSVWNKVVELSITNAELRDELARTGNELSREVK